MVLWEIPVVIPDLYILLGLVPYIQLGLAYDCPDLTICLLLDLAVTLRLAMILDPPPDPDPDPDSPRVARG
jgi:hypothetical protein